MQLFCPNCSGMYSGSDLCPGCGSRLISPSEAFALSADRVPPPPKPVRPTIAGRILVGTIVAAGLFVGLREWAMAGLRAAGQLSDDFWLTTAGVGTAFGLRAVAVAVGGALAGAGRPSGYGTGAAAGVLTGAAFLLVDSAIGVPIRPLEVGLMIALMVVAAVAGAVGSSTWPGPSDVPVSIRESSQGSSLLRLAAGEGQSEIQRPTHWVRLMIATVIGTAGIVAAESIRLGLRTVAGGTFDLGNPATYVFVDLEIAILIVAFAAMAAGATTGSGLRHGVIFGVLLAAAVVGMSVTRGEPYPAVHGLLASLGLPVSSSVSESVLATAAGVFGLGVAGGTLGGAVLPPLGRGERRSRRFK